MEAWQDNFKTLVEIVLHESKKKIDDRASMISRQRLDGKPLQQVISRLKVLSEENEIKNSTLSPSLQGSYKIYNKA